MIAFLIVLSALLIFIGLVVLWHECEPGEGGACWIKWGILWIWRHKAVFALIVAVVVAAVSFGIYQRYYQPEGIFRARSVSMESVRISPVPPEFRRIPTQYPAAFWDKTRGEAEIHLFYSPITKAEVLGNAVIYYGENGRPAIIKVSGLKIRPKIFYDGNLGVMSVILSNREIKKRESLGKVIGYFDAENKLVKLEILDVSAER